MRKTRICTRGPPHHSANRRMQTIEPPHTAETGLGILVVDDDEVFASTLAQSLRQRGFAAQFLVSPKAALSRVAEGDIQALILDLRIGLDSGLRYIAPLRAACPDMRIVLLTGYASIATAVEAIKLGATHYLTKPTSADEILAVLACPEGNSDVVPADGPLTVDRLEWEHIQKVLTAHEGNLSATARALKMHRRTLQRKLAKRPSPN